MKEKVYLVHYDHLLGQRVEGIQLLFYQYFALLVKRLQYSFRKRKAFFVQNILPIFVIIFTLLIAYFLLNVTDPPPLSLQPSTFFGVGPNNYVIVGNNKSGASKDYVDTLFEPCGLGATLLADPNDPGSPCYKKQKVEQCNNYDKLNIHYDTVNCVSECPTCGIDRVPLNNTPPSCYNGTVVSFLLVDTPLCAP